VSVSKAENANTGGAPASETSTSDAQKRVTKIHVPSTSSWKPSSSSTSASTSASTSTSTSTPASASATASVNEHTSSSEVHSATTTASEYGHESLDTRSAAEISAANASLESLLEGRVGSSNRVDEDLPGGDDLTRLIEDAVRTDLFRDQKESFDQFRRSRRDASGVFKDTESNSWGFELTDSFGRRTRRQGFRSKEDAKADFLAAQQQYLGLGLLEAFTNRIGATQELDTAIEGYLQGELQQDHDVVEAVLQSLRSSQAGTTKDSTFPPLMTTAEVAKLSPEEQAKLNNDIVKHARMNFIEGETRETRQIARTLAARIRQLNYYMGRKGWDSAYRRSYMLVSQPNSTIRDLIDAVSSFEHNSVGYQSEAVFPLLMELLKIDKLPAFEVLKTPELKEYAISLQNTKLNSPDAPLRLEEAIPNPSSRSDEKLIEEYEVGLRTVSERMKTSIVRAQNELLLRIPYEMPAELRTLVEKHASLPRPQFPTLPEGSLPFEQGGIYDAQIAERVKKLMELYDHVRTKISVGEKVLKPYAVWHDPAARHAANESAELVKFVREEIAPFLNSWKTDPMDGPGRRSTPLKSINSTEEMKLLEKVVESQSSVKTGKWEAMAKDDGMDSWIDALVSPNSRLFKDTVILNNMKDTSKASLDKFMEESLAHLPIRARADLADIYKNLSKSKGMLTPRLMYFTEAIVNASGPQADLILPILNEFHNSESFWYLLTIGQINSKLEALQAFLAPETVVGRSDARSVHISPMIYDSSKATYTKVSPEFPFIESVTRPVRNGLAVDETSAGINTMSDHLDGFPEAKTLTSGRDAQLMSYSYNVPSIRPRNSEDSFAWLGCDGVWYDEVDNAIRTWYTPDIVGDIGSVESEADLLLSLRKFNELSLDSVKMLSLHRSVRPESAINLENALLRITNSVTTLTERKNLDKNLSKFWFESRLILNPAGWLTTLGRSKALSRTVKGFRLAFGEDLMRSIYPVAIQNLLAVTPERISAVNYLMNPNEDLTYNEESADKNGGNSQSSIQAVSERLASREGMRRPIILRDRRMRYFFDVEKIDQIGKATGIPLLKSGLTPNEEWANRTLFVRNIPLELDEASLKAILEHGYGPIERIAVHREQTLAASENSSKLGLSDTAEAQLAAQKRSAHGSRSSLSKNSAQGSEGLFASFMEDNFPTAMQMGDSVSRIKKRLKNLERMSAMYTRLARDQSYWLDGHWNKADLVMEASLGNASKADAFKVLEAKSPEIANMPRFKLGSMRSSDLNANLLHLTEECESELTVAHDLQDRLADALKRVQKAWKAYVKTLNADDISEADLYALWPETVEELFESGVSVHSDTSRLDTKGIVRAQDKFEEFRSTVMWLNTIMRIVPEQQRVFGEKLNDLLEFVKESQRRNRVVAAALDSMDTQLKADEVLAAAESFEGKVSFYDDDVVNSPKFAPKEEDFVPRGELKLVNESDDNELATFVEADSHAVPMRRASSSWVSDDEHDEGTDATMEDDDDYDGSSIGDDESVSSSPRGGVPNLTDEDLRILELFKSQFNDSRDMNLQDRLDRASAIQRITKSGRAKGNKPKDTMKKVVMEMRPRTGAYAFVTFKDEESFNRANSLAVRTFGMTLMAPTTRRAAENLVEVQEKSDFRNSNCRVSLATNKLNLIVRGLHEGLTAVEVSYIIQEYLQQAFPEIQLNCGPDKKLLSNGSCILEFSTFAETLAAYEALNGRIVLGTPLVVGWSLREDAKARKKRRFTRTPRNRDPLDTITGMYST